MKRWWLPAVLAVATALRLGYLVELHATPWFTQLVVDPEYYDAWARRLAAGDWLGTGAFYMDPLYPYVLGSIYAVAGHGLWLPRLLNVACSVGAVALVAMLGRRVGGPLIGALAALGLAVYEPDIFAVGELDKTSLSMLLVSATLVLAGVGGARASLATGLTLGLATLTRANLLLFLPVRWMLRGTGREKLLFTLGFVAAIAPVTWRNHHVSGEWILTTTQLGQNFYTGNNPENPYGAYGVVSFVRSNPHFEEEDFRVAAEARAGRSLSAGETSRFWLRAAFDHVRTDPGFAFRAFARKAVLVWNDFEISDSQDQYLLERDARILRLPLLGFGAVFALAALGVWAHARRNRSVRLLAAAVLLYAATLVAFFLFARYRIQVVPALLPLAALALTDLVVRVRSGDLRRIAAALAVVTVAGAFSFQTIGLFSPDHPRVVEMRLRHLAETYMTAGDADRAIAALQEAIPHCTHGCPFALADLFEVYRRSGRISEGVVYFEAFVRRYPDQRDAPGYLAALRDAAPAR